MRQLYKRKRFYQCLKVVAKRIVTRTKKFCHSTNYRDN